MPINEGGWTDTIRRSSVSGKHPDPRRPTSDVAIAALHVEDILEPRPVHEPLGLPEDQRRLVSR
jgi:hypothetical protein